jgi:hypothetical protein
MQWEENLTGVISTHVDNIGVTEFQFIGMAIILIPTVIGQNLYQIKVLGFDMVGICILLNVLW